MRLFLDVRGRIPGNHKPHDLAPLSTREKGSIEWGGDCLAALRCMAGITGIVGRGFAEERRAQLETMVRCMRHHPVCTSGAYVNEQLGIWVGWVANPESFCDGMPVW
jgi:hypothetical protein